jgi:predicted amidophosphoribosyltransferase
METGSTFRGEIPLIDVDDLKISVLGRYFPTRYRQHKEREGTLSRCILAAKNSGFPQVIIDGLASAILNYPEDTVITVIPDKQDKRRKRMSTLLKALQSHPALKSYNFSNALLQYLPGAGTLQGMSPEQKTAHLEHYLAVKDSTQIELSAILVIDDIVTHGATLARARHILVDNGALRVDFIAISKTV